jgi:hypothetical protein
VIVVEAVFWSAETIRSTVGLAGPPVGDVDEVNSFAALKFCVVPSASLVGLSALSKL